MSFKRRKKGWKGTKKNYIRKKQLHASWLTNAKNNILKKKSGEKKDLSGELPGYMNLLILRQKEQFLKVEMKESLKVPREKRFVVALLAPNVIGSLHLGHTLMNAYEDTINR